MSVGPAEVLDELCRRYPRNGLVLAIGSGVSAKCKVPTWPQLLERLARRIYGKKGAALYRTLAAEGYTLPAIAGMIEHHSYHQNVSPEEFTEYLREEIYRDFRFFRVGVNREDRDEFLRLVRKNETLRAIAALCVRPDGSGAYDANPSIRAIVNFNFDAILGVYLQARYGGKRRILRTIERPSAGAVPGRIPVYHLHGYLVFNQRRFRHLDKEAPDLRVLTEQEYFDFFNQPTRMGSYSFLHLLREHSCLFVGLSLRDDNIRRLLHYSRCERMSGYVAEGRTRRYAESRSTRHFALLQRSTSAEINALTELSLQRLGTKIVWYDEHTEVPGVLGAVYSSGNGDWEVVY